MIWKDRIYERALVRYSARQANITPETMRLIPLQFICTIPGKQPPTITILVTKDQYGVEVGSKWLKKHLSPEEFAEYMAERLAE